MLIIDFKSQIIGHIKNLQHPERRSSPTCNVNEYEKGRSDHQKIAKVISLWNDYADALGISPAKRDEIGNDIIM